MPKLPNLSGNKIQKILEKQRYALDHQTGSHLIMRQKEFPNRRVTVPNHKNVSTGTLKAIIRETGLTREDFIKK
jgi:predicted RNA binding protein YcfA (HicA-like mRNA interferase family)